MRNLKPILKLAPEIYLILACVFYWASTANMLNPVAIILLSVLVFQVIFKVNFTGLFLAVTFLILNVYMCFALASELREFTSQTENYWQMLIVGTLFFGFNLSMSILMFGKYLRNIFLTTEKKMIGFSDNLPNVVFSLKDSQIIHSHSIIDKPE